MQNGISHDPRKAVGDFYLQQISPTAVIVKGDLEVKEVIYPLLVIII